MQKPDTAAIRNGNHQPIQIPTDTAVPLVRELTEKAQVIDWLCDYIDNLDTELKALTWYFIDSGLNKKKKPTAEEIIEKCLESDYELNGTRIAVELREAGYLNDGEK